MSSFENVSKALEKIRVVASEWPTPEPLAEDDLISGGIPVPIIPSALDGWVMPLSDRMQVTPDFVLAPLLVGISSLIGRKVGIFPKASDDWLVVPNLWGAVIARPGYFKSPILAEAFRGISKLASEAAQEFEKASRAASVKEEILKAKSDGIREAIKKSAKKGDEAEIERLQGSLQKLKDEEISMKPVAKRYITNDTTIEKLALILKENPQGVLLCRDELFGWLKNLGRHGREGDREFYLESWNGYGDYTIDRVGRGTIHIPALCLSIFGGIQPGKLEQYVAGSISGGEEDDGLLQRFQILVYPEMPRKWCNVDSPVCRKAEIRLWDLFRQLDRLDIDALEPVIRGEKKGLEFAKDAQGVFNSWRCQLENRLRSGMIGCPSFESHLAKYRSLMPSLALIFHLIELSSVSFVSSIDKGKISVEHAELAVRWVDFLEKHARKVYRLALEPQIPGAKALLQKIKAGKVTSGDSLRSIYRNQWSMLDSKKKLEGAVGVLEKHRWLRVEERENGGRVSEHIRLSPHLSL